MFHLPAELRSIVLSYVPIATLANIFKIPQAVPCASHELHRRSVQVTVMREVKCVTEYYHYYPKEITHFYGLYALNAQEGLLYYFHPYKCIDVSHLAIASIIYCRCKVDQGRIVYDILYLTSNQDLCLARSCPERVTSISYLWNNVTVGCVARLEDSAALFCNTAVYLTDRIFDDDAVWNKLPCLINNSPREMQLWNIGSTQYLAVLDCFHTLSIYSVVSSLPIHIVSDVATLSSGLNSGGYINLNDRVFTWNRTETVSNFDEIQLIPYHGAYLLYYYEGGPTSSCTYCPNMPDQTIELRVTFDPVLSEERSSEVLESISNTSFFDNFVLDENNTTLFEYEEDVYSEEEN